MYPWSPVSIGGTHPPQPPSAHLPHHIPPSCSVQILPNGLARSPYLWTKEHVRAWLEFCSDDFSIEHIRPDKFDMNGKALCLLTRKDFMERDPSSGDLLYNALQRLLSTKNELSLHPHLAGMSASFAHNLSPRFKVEPPHTQAASPNGIIFLTGTGSGHYAGATTTAAPAVEGHGGNGSGLNGACSESNTHTSSENGLARTGPIPILPQPTLPLAMSQPPVTSVGILSVADHKPTEVPESVLSPAPTTDQDSTSSDADSVNNESATYERIHQDGGQENGYGHMQSNATPATTATANNINSINGLHNANGHSNNSHPDSIQQEEEMDLLCRDNSGDCRLLWEFIYQLLQERASISRNFVCWEGNGSDLVFRIVNPTGLAELWGHQKNRSNMTYEKLSRALRYYYKMNIIKKVPGKRLTYKFLQHPTKIQKGQRGAKPHCMRNLPPNNPPPQLAPNPPQLQPHSPLQPLLSQLSPQTSTPRLSPAHSRPPSLSPPVMDDLPGGPPPAASPQGSPHDRHVTPNRRSLSNTPVHMNRRASVSPGEMDEHVRSSLKDRLSGRVPLIHAKLEAETVVGVSQQMIREELQRRHLEIELHRHHQQQQQQQQQHRFGLVADFPPHSKMDCDEAMYQEEPEDLSVKPSRKDSAFSCSSSSSSSSPSSIKGNPPLSSVASPNCYPPCSYSPSPYPPRVSPIHPHLYQHQQHPGYHLPRSFNPQPSKSYPPSPVHNNNNDDTHADDKRATAGLVVPLVTLKRSCPEEFGFSAMSDTSSAVMSIVKTEPLHVIAS
ncbi:ets DNA-binding protein pokkuri-like isoform X2 [Littorina saxatilis]|uniref:Transcription factor ETV6 n=2 Tax=Littorina saxatilis TaxID=31220 RepID=A0AAN9G9U9_9CAEN